MKINREELENTINDYLMRNSSAVEKKLCKFAGVSSIDELHQLDYNMKWGADCGLVYLIAEDDDIRKQLKKQSEYPSLGTSDRIYPKFPYNTQSTTLQRVQAEMAVDYILDTMGIAFIIGVWLD